VILLISARNKGARKSGLDGPVSAVPGGRRKQ
jgi:hypothetical protein